MLRRLVGTTSSWTSAIVQFRNEKVSNHGSIPITIDCNVGGLHRFLKNFTPNAAVLFVDVAIQPEVRFIAKQNSLMKIGNNGNLVFGPFDESTPCFDDRFDELPNQTENKLT
ncbi:adhesion G protein-coupled receptor B2 [Trichonephila clavipes]|nr:adhesion G protein-coupled receptor B2 [Trichonephila clavipes]